MKFNRVFVVVIDSLKTKNCGNDNCKYPLDIPNSLDEVSHKMYEKYDGFNIPNLQKLGLANLHGLKGVEAVESPLGNIAKLAPIKNSNQKVHSHIDMLGSEIQAPYRVFSKEGFPKELIQELERHFGKKIAGNRIANATTILNKLSYRESNFDEVIVYASKDSVLQICGNEDVMGLDRLYNYCEIAREITLKDEWYVKKVIARPYVINRKGECTFTANKREYPIHSDKKTYLDGLKSYGYDVIAVGNIDEIFENNNITSTNPSTTKTHGMEKTIEIATSNFRGLCFTNLAGLDALSNQIFDDDNLIAYGKEIEKFDEKLGNLMTVLNYDDLLIITANHSDESDVVPMISYSKNREVRCGCNLGQFENMAMIGATVAHNFGIGEVSDSTSRSLLHFM